jgi:hypothetical protein
VSDWIEQDGKRYINEEYLAMANNTNKRRGETIKALETERDALRAALEPIVKMLNVGDNHGPTLEMDGIPMFRPIEAANRDRLGTLFTLLFNARVALEQPAAQSSERGEAE